MLLYRLAFSWEERRLDFERYTKPPVDFGVTHPATIHCAGDSRKRELDEYLTEEQAQWEERLVVDDTRLACAWPTIYGAGIVDKSVAVLCPPKEDSPIQTGVICLYGMFPVLSWYACMHTHQTRTSRFHTLRKGSQTEQTSKGRKAGSQLDKLQGLMKDAPQKHSFKVHSHTADTPLLSTLHSFGLSGKKDSNIAGDEGVGFHPAELVKGSLKLDRNVIPIANN